MSFLDDLFGVTKAKNAASNAAAQNRTVASDAYTNAQTLQSPFYSQGQTANNLLGDYLGLNGTGAQTTAFNNYQQSPDVAFRTQQGINAIDNSYAGRTGGTPSGGLYKALINYGTGAATQDYGNYLSRLAAQSAQGQTAANTLTGANYNSANLTSNANTAEGNAIANASLTGGNILQNLISGGLGLAGNLGWNPFGGSSGGSFNQQQGQMTGNRFW